MAGGQWEVVGGKSKKTKPKNGPIKTKEKKKQDNPAFEASAPICESQTIYNAFLEKEKKEPLKLQKATTSEPVKGKDKNIQKKKKDKKIAPSSKINLEEIYAKITEDDLKTLFTTLEVLWPTTPLVWLKDLASFLNVKLDALVEDPVFTGKPIGYPSVLLHKRVYSFMYKSFNRCSAQTLHLFYDHCLQFMVQDTLKGIPTLGYRTVLQCLSQEIPSLATTGLARCIEICNSHQNRQNICLSVMWAAGQAGNKDLEAGFCVWTDLMFPLTSTKTCTAYAIDYLERLVCSEDINEINKSIISVKNLFHILDFIFSKDLGKSVQKRLISVYPTLKSLSYGPEPETVLRNYFPSYLVRLDPPYTQAMKEEILSSLVYCLEKDTRNYSIWRQLYFKHFNQSKILIAHLNEQWENLPPKFPRKCLLDTLSVFQVTNEELYNSGKKEPVVEECMKINKELLSKINSQIFSWIRVVVVFVLMFSLLLTYDILIHDSFIESHTGRLMKDAGLLVICAQAGEKLSYYYGKTYKLLEMYVPTIVVWVQKVIFPYFELFWKQLITTCAYAWNSSSIVREWCGKNIHDILLIVDAQAPVYGRWILSISKSLKVFLHSYFQTAINFLWYCSESAVLWIQSNTLVQNFVGSFTHFAAAIVETLQEHAVSLLHIVKSYISS